MSGIPSLSESKSKLSGIPSPSESLHIFSLVKLILGIVAASLPALEALRLNVCTTVAVRPTERSILYITRVEFLIKYMVPSLK